MVVVTPDHCRVSARVCVTVKNQKVATPITVEQQPSSKLSSSQGWVGWLLPNSCHPRLVVAPLPHFIAGAYAPPPTKRNSLQIYSANPGCMHCALDWPIYTQQLEKWNRGRVLSSAHSPHWFCVQAFCMGSTFHNRVGRWMPLCIQTETGRGAALLSLCSLCRHLLDKEPVRSGRVGTYSRLRSQTKK